MGAGEPTPINFLNRNESWKRQCVFTWSYRIALRIPIAIPQSVCSFTSPERPDSVFVGEHEGQHAPRLFRVRRIV
jgi:hypothetical protein